MPFPAHYMNRALKSNSEKAEWLFCNGGWSNKIDCAGRKENDYFSEVLGGICDILQELTIDGRENRFKPVHKPYKAASSSIPGGPHKMDGAFYLLDDSARPSEYYGGHRRLDGVQAREGQQDRCRSKSVILPPFLHW